MPDNASTAKITTLGFDWGDMAIERCYEDKSYRCVRIRSMSTGRYVDIRLSPQGRHMDVSPVLKDDRLKGYDPCGGKETFEEIFKRKGPLCRCSGQFVSVDCHIHGEQSDAR